ncbi:hypothetical protein GTQ45_03255 [Pyruvatibacter mobilis]|uniref:Peptidoglycan binding-like domain-containing protein n=1 Tax=Pyruvatibacter mobilis TaxID=1712261 RepID=A0A845Q8H5_9HYPH|nr:peptidoglycan-binding protein [Pyruvatibacter mobilis]NBG94744.1 hypothetical protein [Pyruvatibacter mobilis]QJD75941.1 hypothetical protein HG718_11285 [Pyruvatibacter mobilis]GGD19800.1 hypothetical protein GCM10011587_25400 [Pyruvatibacter mobilis]
MRPGVPWSVKGIEPEAREAAKSAARREGKTLGQWLNEKIIDASDADMPDMPGAPASTPPASPTGTPMPQQALQIDFSPVTDALRDLVHRLERSERRSETALSGLDDALADMSARLDQTERLSRDGGMGGNSGLETTLSELRERLEKSERGLEKAEMLNTDAMRTVERGLRAISNRLEETERRAEEAATRARSVDTQTPEVVRSLQSSLSDLSRRLDKTETAVDAAREQAMQAASAATARSTSNDDAVSALERAIGNVVDHIEASDTRTAKALSGLRGDLEKLEKAAADTKPGVSVEAIQSLEGTIAALQQNLAEVTGRIGQVETNAQRDVDQIARAIDDMGGRLDGIREGAIAAAAEAARKETSPTAQLVAQLEERVEATRQQAADASEKIEATNSRIAQAEQHSADAIQTIETSVSDIAGQMRQIADLTNGGKSVFAEPLAALEAAIADMGERLQTTDQRSAQALAKVEEVSDELLRKIDSNQASDDIREIKASVENVDARLNLIEASAKTDTSAPAAPEMGFMASAPQADTAVAPPPPPQGDWTGTREDGPFTSGFGPMPEAGTMGAPPFDGAQGAGEPPFPDFGPQQPDAQAAQPDAGGRNSFLESARQAARAAAGAPGSESARSPFADPAAAYDDTQSSSSRKPLALIAAALAVVAVAGLVVTLMGGGQKDVAGPPDDVAIPSDVLAEIDGDATDITPAATGSEPMIVEGTVTDLTASPDGASPADNAGGTDGADAAAPDTTDVAEAAPAPTPAPERAPARELPDVVTDAQASAPADVPRSAEQAVAGEAINGPKAITPRKNVDVASLEPGATSPARQTLREAATNGDAAAQYEIGQRYATGSSGLPQDDDQAAYWITRAAEQGLAPAQYRLGTMFEKGVGVPENPTKARSWYERAAGQGNVKAMHNLAVMLAEGAGGPQDFAAAARSFTAAADRGLADSQYNLAILHERGLGVERNLAEAYKWFSVAAANGDADAGARAEALKNSVDAAKLVDAELAARTFAPKASDPAANEVAWAPKLTTAAMVREAQRLLGALGYDAGPADGQPGSRTLDAVRQFERDKGMAVTGRIDARLLDALERAAI